MSIESDEELTLAQFNRERIARDLAPHIPPEHIVTCDCTFKALTRYLTMHPLETIHAREAMRMSEGMHPAIKAHQAENPPWGLLDIIGDNPEVDQNETGDGKLK